ncbi:MAG: S26 family signal peptidase [Planctomycetota bacterium]
MNRRTAFVVAVAVTLTLGLFAAPRRYVVDGVSMGPGLLPGDVVSTGWFAELDRWRPPERFDRWIVTLPDGSTGLKRVAGLAGETVALVAGDLVVDGRTVLKGPRLLAGLGSALDAAGPAGSAWSQAPALVLDDAPFATGEVSRLLLPVHDAGFAAEVVVAAGAVRTGPVRVRARVGPLSVVWRLPAAGRYAVVAGRLDGHAVAAAWPVGDRTGSTAGGRLCLPAAAPDRWPVARPWAEVTDADDEDRSPPLALDVTGADEPAVIERITTWRDVLLRPAAAGVATWSLAAGEIFVLGDFPSGSRDSRHFGPLERGALRQRIRPWAGWGDW